MPFGLSRRRNPHGVVMSSPNHYVPEKFRAMVLRLNIDCNACCRKLRRIVLRMKGIESHMIEKQQRRLFVCGRFVPADVAIHIKKKMNRRVEILQVHELGGSETSERDQTDNNPDRDGPPAENICSQPPVPMVAYPGQAPSCQPVMPLAYCKSGYSAMEIVEVWESCDCTCVTEGEDEVPYDEDITGLEEPYWENDYPDEY
ncbi:heavy metal-associated isoprenylated plant protein 8 [Neltuma alba]|uniref:heavy metal-associated isoprenylated plant protein 8 n=1 Tax=Neltuma alba TaxID=207710 RepID=UPI0010A330CC|nr:heavy metal-associated isoprenylated plant protein 8-like [Prosopis alba]